MRSTHDTRTVDASLEARAVSWLADHRDFLDPANADDSTALFARKALVEVALLVGLRARLDPQPLEPDYAALLDTISAVAGRPSYRELVCRDRRALLLYAGTYAALRLCGHDDAEFRHVVEQSVRGRYSTLFERVPYRHLDLVHTLELAGIDHAGPGVPEALTMTLLAADPNALEMSTSDAYAITHAIFYASDFGQRSIKWPTGTCTAGVVALVDECLLLARARADADLVGELLICLTCLGAPMSAAQSSAREWLHRWQEPDGRLEGPVGVIPDRLVTADPAWGSWATAYHTTIVAALEDLLRRTAPHSTSQPAQPAQRWMDAPPARDRAIRLAAQWLGGAAPADDVRAAVWTAEAWTAVGDQQRACAALRRTTQHPDLEELLDQGPGDVAIHLAALSSVLGMDCPLLDDLLARVEAAVVGADPTDGRFDAARAHLARARGRVFTSRAVPAETASGCDGGLRVTSLALCSDLIIRGRAPEVSQSSRQPALQLLARSAQQAAADYDLGWLAVVIRGLLRLPEAPARLVRDCLDLLESQQALSGAIGAPLVDDPGERSALQFQWTLLALAALVEARPGRSPGRAGA